MTNYLPTSESEGQQAREDPVLSTSSAEPLQVTWEARPTVPSIPAPSVPSQGPSSLARGTEDP